MRSGAWFSGSLAPIDDLVAGRGLAHAAAVFVVTRAHLVPPAGVQVPPLVQCSEATDTGEILVPGFWDDAARHLRSMLATAPQDVYDDAVAALTPLRGGLLRQRIAASYLMPDIHDWVNADLADLPATYRGPGGLLFYSAATVEQVSRTLE